MELEEGKSSSPKIEYGFGNVFAPGEQLFLLENTLFKHISKQLISLHLARTTRVCVFGFFFFFSPNSSLLRLGQIPGGKKTMIITGSQE